MSHPSVSLIVPTLNEEQHIRALIESVVAQTYEGEFEVIVSDGGSTDRTCQIVDELARQYPWLRRIDNPGRTQARGFNRGLRVSSGDVVGYVGAHSRLAPDYLEQTVAALEESGASGVGGRWTVISMDRRSESIAIAMACPYGVGTADYRYRQEPVFTDTVLYGSYLRSALVQVGGIDESLAVNEDYELNYRLRAAGHRLYYSPAIHIHYYSRSSLGKLWRQYFSYGFWKARVLRQHPRSVRLRHLAAPAFVLCLAGAPLALLHPWLAAVVGAALLGYAVLTLGFSVALAIRHGWRHLPLLPVIFFSLHAAWGLGFFCGIWKWWVRQRRESLAAASAGSGSPDA